MSKARKDEYDVYLVDSCGDSEHVLRTRRRELATAKVAQLIADGSDETNIYAEYGGDNFRQARYHLLLPEQNYRYPVTSEQAALILGIKARAVQAKAKALGVGVRFGRALAFTAADIERMRAGGARGPKPRAARGE